MFRVFEITVGVLEHEVGSNSAQLNGRVFEISFEVEVLVLIIKRVFITKILKKFKNVKNVKIFENFENFI